MENWDITYDTPITSDVLGYQTSEDINNVLKEISNLQDYRKESNSNKEYYGN